MKKQEEKQKLEVIREFNRFLISIMSDKQCLDFAIAADEMREDNEDSCAIRSAASDVITFTGVCVEGYEEEEEDINEEEDVDISVVEKEQAFLEVAKKGIEILQQ